VYEDRLLPFTNLQDRKKGYHKQVERGLHRDSLEIHRTMGKTIEYS